MRFRLMILAAGIAMGASMVSTGEAISQSNTIPWKLDETTARNLAVLAVGHGAEPGDFNYGGASEGYPFFVFDGLSRSPAEGSFGFFAVNPWTGDVWALWGCHKLSTPKLRQSQADIRRRFTADELKQYARLRNLKPDCTVERP